MSTTYVAGLLTFAGKRTAIAALPPRHRVNCHPNDPKDCPICDDIDEERARHDAEERNHLREP